MKKSKRTISALLAVCMIIPLSVFLTAKVRAVPEAPLPYTLEALGQKHFKIYKTVTTPVQDGVISEGEYTLLETFTRTSTGGIFTSSNASLPTTVDPELLPSYAKYYGAYDDNYLYLAVVSQEPRRKTGSYKFATFIGFNFFAHQRSSTTRCFTHIELKANGTKAITLSTSNYFDPTTNKVTSSIARTYTAASYAGKYEIALSTDENNNPITIYELALAWEDLRSADFYPNESIANIDKVYLYTYLSVWDTTGATDKLYCYWCTGVSNINATLISGKSLKLAYTSDYSSVTDYVPDVLHLMGNRPASQYPEVAPEVIKNSLTSSSTAGKSAIKFELEFAKYSSYTSSDIAEMGVLLTNSEAMGRYDMKLDKETRSPSPSSFTLGSSSYPVTKIVAANKVETADKITFDYVLDNIGDNDRNTYYSIRPYVIYQDGSIVYGQYSTNSVYLLSNSEPEYYSEMSVLMVGNSFCYYFCDELVGVGRAAGIKFTIGRLYKSGCRLNEHWAWLNNDYAGYSSYTVFTPTSETSVSNYKLKDALESRNWDVISIQQHFKIPVAVDKNQALKSFYPYITNISDYFDRYYPSAKKYVHQIWAFQVGFSRSDSGDVPDVQTQTEMYEGMKYAFQKASEYIGYDLIPSGDAWQLARANSIVGDTLCREDLYHDGQAGGQYLNACVWFEVLTRKSCIGNTYVPSYATAEGLTSEKIAVLQQAAHDAVTAVYGSDYYIN